jgi:hypothetical protein
LLVSELPLPHRLRFFLQSNIGKDVLLVFGVAAFARFLMALYQINYGVGTIPWFPLVVPWSDFYSIYVGELTSLAQGSLSYATFFTYTPLFLYTLYPFFRLGGSSFASIPILLADAVTAPLVYLNARTFTRNKVAIAAGLSYALSPMMLIMEGYLWLSNQPMFFFMILALYFLRQDKPVLSSLSIGIAIMFKQEASFILPAYAVMYLNRYRKSAWKGIAVFISTISFVSLPFLLSTPLSYFDAVSYGLLGKFLPLAEATSSSHIANSGSTTLSYSTSASACRLISSGGATSVASCQYGLVTYVQNFPRIVLGWITILNWASGIILVPLLIMVGILLFFSRRRNNFFELACAYSLITLLSLFSFLVHGLFTYYFIPVYGILLASCKDFRAVLISTVAAFASLFMIDGLFQAVLPLIAIYVILATNNLNSGALDSKTKPLGEAGNIPGLSQN